MDTEQKTFKQIREDKGLMSKYVRRKLQYELKTKNIISSTLFCQKESGIRHFTVQEHVALCKIYGVENSMVKIL